MEGFAIHISETLYGGFKSKLNSVDLEFEREGKYYIVGIKSGTNWGNSDQINRMKDNFKRAKIKLRELRFRIRRFGNLIDDRKIVKF